MEDDNDLEQVTGSPSSGENEFVHVESVDSAQMDVNSIDQVEHLEQDDGVVVTGVDAVQDELHAVRTHEDGGHDEFVDCPDDLLSSGGRSPASESRPRQLPFRDDTEHSRNQASEIEKQIIPQDYEEERRMLIKEVTNLHRQLKALSKQQPLIDASYAGESSDLTSGTEEGDEKSVIPLREMVNECSGFIELSLNERLQSEGTIKELYATLHAKDKEIEDLMTRVNEQSISHDVQSFEAVADRVLSSLAVAFGDAELSDTSVSGKLSHIEKSTMFLLENYHNVLSEMQMLAHCLAEVNSDFQMENGMVNVFPSVRDELVRLKRKEFELNEKNTLLEYQHGQLMEQLDKNRETIEVLNAEIGKLKAEVEQEKLSMAVKKGKGLVQERENMKQQMAEKNTQIEALMVDFQKQESTFSDYRDQIAKLESERDQTGQLLAQSNMMLQEIVEIIDGINILFSVDLKEPVEKVKWFTTCLSEWQIAKAQAELELGYVKGEANELASKLTEALTNMKSLEDALLVSEKNVSQLSEEKRELEVSKIQAEQEMEILKDESGRLNIKLMETLKTLKLLEDKVADSEKTISLLTEEKSELEVAKCRVEEELHKAREEVTSQTSKFQEALALAENNMSMIMSEKEEAQMEVHKVKEEVSSHASNLDEAKKTIKSLEDAILQLNTNVSRFSQENEKAEDSRTVLVSEIKKLKEEAEQEISTLKTELATCRQELASKNGKMAPQLEGFFGNLQVFLKDESLLFSFKQSFERKVESLREIDRLLKDMKDNIDSEQLQDHHDIEELQSPPFLPAGFENDWNTGLIYDEFNAEDTEGIGLYVGRTLDNLNTKNQILANQFGNFSTLIDDIIGSLLKQLEAIRNNIPFMVQQTISLQQNMKSMQMDKQMQDNKMVMLENSIKVLVSVCADVTKDLKFHLENHMLQTDPTIGVDDVAVTDVKAAADELLSAARNIQSVIKQHVSDKENMSTTLERLKVELEKNSSMYDNSKEVIKELESELEKSRSMYDKSKEVIEELHGELEKTRSVYEEVKEENDALQRKVMKFETELEASRNTCKEMSPKLEDYRAKEEKWNAREKELSAQSIPLVKDHEGDSENALLSASQIKTLFDKIDGITVPFPNLIVGETQPLDSNPVKKLFYIIDSVNELLDQLTLLTHAKEDLRSTLSKQAFEVDLLKGEYKDGLQNIIQKFGGDESIGVKKPADVAGLLLVLERLVQGIVLDGKNSRSKAQELSSRVKFLEDFIQNRTGASDTIQKAPSLPAGSEISEIDDQVAVGKAGLPLVPSAAQMRSLRKGSNEQLAITIDSDSERLLDRSATVEDKGHIFKSLHTSGLVPVQGKMIADRLDGIWVSGGQALMRRPRARLGLIAYWLVLHLWLLGTIL
ncbi:hypothetical protein HanIR_Chr08g0343801 [Helianthus annuus]|nr:hypothetical protein HanIR_Chr08g0343801 [Helianthus annuus]